MRRLVRGAARSLPAAADRSREARHRAAGLVRQSDRVPISAEFAPGPIRRYRPSVKAVGSPPRHGRLDPEDLGESEWERATFESEFVEQGYGEVVDRRIEPDLLDPEHAHEFDAHLLVLEGAINRRRRAASAPIGPARPLRWPRAAGTASEADPTAPATSPGGAMHKRNGGIARERARSAAPACAILSVPCGQRSNLEQDHERRAARQPLIIDVRKPCCRVKKSNFSIAGPATLPGRPVVARRGGALPQ